MRKLLLTCFLLCALPAWATCTLSNVVVNSGGAYSNSTPPTVGVTGPGSGGAVAQANMAYFTGPNIWYVSSVTVTNGGSYTGYVSISFNSTGNQIGGGQAAGYAVMGGSCGGGGGGKKRSAWLL